MALARDAAGRGAKEIVLTGVNIGDFGHSNLLSFQLRVAARYHNGRIRIAAIERTYERPDDAKAISEIVNKWEYEY